MYKKEKGKKQSTASNLIVNNEKKATYIRENNFLLRMFGNVFRGLMSDRT